MSTVLKVIFVFPEPHGAEYVLQFLLRDLTSKFDLIGPYFMCSKSVDHGFVSGCLFETMRALNAYGFHVSCLVCDGASSNMRLIKSTLGISGSLSSENEDSSLDMSFANPFQEGLRCYWIICLSHKLKNMISALNMSRVNGSRDFVHNDIYFGWSDICDLKARDDERVKNGQIRCVRGLLTSYIERDSWTRLNVKPSKIMQQEEVLSELYTYAMTGGNGCQSALKTHEYLTACNQLFERGFLCHNPVYDNGSPVLNNINIGYMYFVQWLNQIRSKLPDFSLSSRQSPFIASQTWDLLRICVHGIRGLVTDFSRRNSGYFIVLSRINGSAVESLFSQMKYATSGKLSSVNYESARKSVLIRSNVCAKSAANKDYRDDNLELK